MHELFDLTTALRPKRLTSNQFVSQSVISFTCHKHMNDSRVALSSIRRVK